MLVGLPTAQAADTTLTLVCRGAVTQNDANPEPISMGVIIDFAARTVQGFGYPVEITATDDVLGTFARSAQPTIDGTVDHVTGDLQATFVMLSKNNNVLLEQLLTEMHASTTDVLAEEMGPDSLRRGKAAHVSRMPVEEGTR
jgi:hypothetical protein